MYSTVLQWQRERESNGFFRNNYYLHRVSDRAAESKNFNVKIPSVNIFEITTKRKEKFVVKSA